MSITDRVYRIERLIRARGQVSLRELMAELEVSRATIKRDLDYLRDRLGAPIAYDAALRAYRFAEPARERRHELPGLWFDERELYSLLLANQLLAELDSDGTLGRHLQPLLGRIHQVLGGGETRFEALAARVRIVAPAKRPVPQRWFERACQALLERRRLQMRYLTRGRGEVSERTVSPQRLVHYRSTWYLDAWCHTRQRLLRFALDAIEQAQVSDEAAREMAPAEVAAAMDAGYGIFAGATPQTARLRFDAQAALWASRELWHPQQQGRWLADGGWELELPYVDETELAMDVLRQGPEVRVLAPPSLAARVARLHAQAAALYDEVPPPPA